VRTNNLADDFRSNMVEADVFDFLVGLLQNGNAAIGWSSIQIITALVKFGRLMYHFVPCEN
jgi:hypothetical protein